MLRWELGCHVSVDTSWLWMSTHVSALLSGLIPVERPDTLGCFCSDISSWKDSAGAVGAMIGKFSYFPRKHGCSGCAISRSD